MVFSPTRRAKTDNQHPIFKFCFLLEKIFVCDLFFLPIKFYINVVCFTAALENSMFVGGSDVILGGYEIIAKTMLARFTVRKGFIFMHLFANLRAFHTAKTDPVERSQKFLPHLQIFFKYTKIVPQRIAI